jgi:hypothetical protein
MKMLAMMLRCAPLLTLAACAPRAVLAQDRPDSVHHRNDCRLAAQVISTGQPLPRREWALAVIQGCREGGPALARAMRESRLSSDTAYLNALTWPAIRLRDGEIFQAAMQVAADRGASTQARVFAIRTLMWSMYPGGGIDYADLADLVQGRPRSCFGHGPSTHTSVTQGAALPVDFVARAKELAKTLDHDPTEPLPVRRAAVCLTLVRPWSGVA